jgi:hypothetical protein
MKVGLIRFGEIEQKRQQADYSDDIDKIFPVNADETKTQINGLVDVQKLAALMSSQSEADEPSILLSELWEQFQAEHIKAGRWGPSTIKKYLPQIRILIQVVVRHSSQRPSHSMASSMWWNVFISIPRSLISRKICWYLLRGTAIPS